MRGFVVIYPGCIMAEVDPTIDLLKTSRPLKVVTLDSLPSVAAADFLVIPGGSCDQAVVHAELHDLIRGVLRQGGFVAGICNGAVVLASAGVLDGKRCTHTVVPKYAPASEFRELLELGEKIFKGSTYVDEDIVIDDNVITAKPHAAVAFAKAVESKVKV